MTRKPSPAAEVLAQAAQAAKSDPVLKELDAVLAADPLCWLLWTSVQEIGILQCDGTILLAEAREM